MMDDVDHHMDDDTFLEPSTLVQRHQEEMEARRKSLTTKVPAYVASSWVGWTYIISIIVHVTAIILFIGMPIVIAIAHSGFCFKCGGAEFLIMVGLAVLGCCFMGVGLVHPIRQYIQERKKKRVTHDDLLHHHQDEEILEDFDEDGLEELQEQIRGLESRVPTSVISTVDIKKQHILGCSFFIVSAIGLLILAVTIVVFLFLVSFVNSTKVSKSGGIYTSKITGGTVKIERESNGMVHIVAENELDLAYGQGFACAQDRLFQMELYKRVCQGTLSEIAGPDALIVDKLSRILGFRKYSEENMANIPESTKQIVQSYVNGVNAFIETNPPLSAEFSLLKFKPTNWTMLDVLSFEKMLALQMTVNHVFELARLVVLENGVSLERVTELSTPMHADQFTIFTKEELGMNLSDEEAQIIEQRLFNQSGAFIPKNTETAARQLEKTLTSDKYLNMFFPTKKGRSRGSNNWVISKDLTDSSSGYNANDPHLDFSAPIIFHQVHLKIVKDVSKLTTIEDIKKPLENKDEYNYELFGSSMVGLPGVGIGRNHYISWSITLSFTDTQDFYVLTPCPHYPDTHYLIDGQSVPYTIRKEVIKVLDGEDIELQVKESRFGPVYNTIINNADTGNTLVKTSNPIALKWTAHLPNDTTIMGLQQMMRSQTIDEFVKGTHLLSAFPFCVVFSDRKGNIGYSLTGTTPIRREGHTGMFPVRGDVSTFEYQGYASGDQITVINPKKGYIITANNRITPAGYPHIISNDNEFDYRARRINDMIQNVINVEKRKITQQDMINIQNDVYSLIYEELKFVLRNISISLDNDAKYSKFVTDLLENWNGRIERTSTHAALFESFLTNLIKLPQEEVVTKYWNDFYYIRKAMTSNNDKACTVYRKKSCQEFALDTFRETVDSLLKHFGKIPQWNQLHYIDAAHPLLGLTPLSCLSDRHLHSNGGTYTVNINNFVYDAVTDTKIPTVNAAVYRQIIGGGDFSEEKIENQDDLWVLPLGQDGNMFSSHYDNMMDYYIEGKYYPWKSDPDSSDITETFTINLQSVE